MDDTLRVEILCERDFVLNDMAEFFCFWHLIFQSVYFFAQCFELLGMAARHEALALDILAGIKDARGDLIEMILRIGISAGEPRALNAWRQRLVEPSLVFAQEGVMRLCVLRWQRCLALRLLNRV